MKLNDCKGHQRKVALAKKIAVLGKRMILKLTMIGLHLSIFTGDHGD